MQRPLQALRDNGQRTTNRRGAFSLIELIVVILIIAILSSLLLVGVQAAVGRARVTAVSADIKNLEQGIKEFQTKFQLTEAPPSRVVVYEDYDSWPNASTATSSSAAHQAIRRNVATIRRLWPDFLDATGRPALGSMWEQDINGNGTIETSAFELSGAECLVFFLGGIMTKQGTNYLPLGFSSNPQNPFAAGGTRIGPFVAFIPSRLEDKSGNDFPEYLDAFPGSTAPYQYFSAYAGRGYSPLGADNAAGGSDINADEVFPGSSLVSVYLQKDKNFAMTMGLPQAGVAWNAKSFQIISAGRDGAWGYGGEVTDSGIPTGGLGTYRTDRAAERDNIVNFKGGTLE